MALQVNEIKDCLEKIKELKINFDHFTSISKFRCSKFKFFLFNLTFCVCIVLFFNNGMFKSDECFVSMPDTISRAFRSPEDCTFCRNIDRIERVSNLSPQEFERKYAYNGKPVIVSDATANWTAMNVFNFQYFKDIYKMTQYSSRESNCQFFPYKTEFKSLDEALDMPIERINYEPNTKPWYFGWSVCNYEIGHELRKHYDRPYFLPETSENNAVDWIFMGGSGLGAHMHVDNVRLPSWQAQIKGTKQWTLAPPPECYYVCSSIPTIIRTGDIIVLDTNRWYHKTLVQSGEISITIGAEYD